ncbi:hypothetical protein N8T08_002548 [Aspergillus melleus]|uniref:Uncharacterized protein n=1 Tax=Aspergillus melleus TaxID=138277 RepID=A0ACC3B8Y2_9EURO|nr:hypothetical protein N8T08_002548 [Aspergillus melleus]
MGSPKLIFGVASFGMDFVSPDEVQEILDFLKQNKIIYIDTAGRYPPTAPGRSEELLGEAKAANQGFTIDTKILTQTTNQGGHMERSAVERSLEISLRRMGIGQFGVSNFKPDLLQKFLATCEAYGYVKPTVYQGDYSAVNRGMEKKLLPILRKHGIAYNAFR